MAILMEYDLIGVFHRKVEQNKVAVLAALVEPCQLDGFTLPQRNKVAQLAGVAEGDNLERHGEVDCLLGEQSPKDEVHLLETQGHITGTAVAGIGNHGKVRRVHFNPLGFFIFSTAGNCDQKKCAQQNGRKWLGSQHSSLQRVGRSAGKAYIRTVLSCLGATVKRKASLARGFSSSEPEISACWPSYGHRSSRQCLRLSPQFLRPSCRPPGRQYRHRQPRIRQRSAPIYQVNDADGRPAANTQAANTWAVNTM